MCVVTVAALVQLCVIECAPEPGFPDIGDGIGGAIAISGSMATGTNSFFLCEG